MILKENTAKAHPVSLFRGRRGGRARDGWGAIMGAMPMSIHAHELLRAGAAVELTTSRATNLSAITFV